MPLGVFMAHFRKFIFFSLFLVFISGCNFQTKDLQLIEIKAFSDKEKNDQVAQALMYYTPTYFMHHIPSLNEKNYSGVQPGYVRPSNTNISNFRVFYVTSDSNLKSTAVNSLKREFEKHIPIMAKNHAEAWELQENESIKKGKWLKEFINSSNQDEYKDAFVADTPENYLTFFLSYPKKIQEQVGLANDIKYLRYQYYKPFGEFKEQLVLNYEANFDNGRKVFFNMSLNSRQEITILEVH